MLHACAPGGAGLGDCRQCLRGAASVFGDRQQDRFVLRRGHAQVCFLDPNSGPAGARGYECIGKAEVAANDVATAFVNDDQVCRYLCAAQARFDFKWASGCEDDRQIPGASSAIC